MDTMRYLQEAFSIQLSCVFPKHSYELFKQKRFDFRHHRLHLQAMDSQPNIWDLMMREICCYTCRDKQKWATQVDSSLQIAFNFTLSVLVGCRPSIVLR